MKAQKTDRTERQGIGIAIDIFESLGFAFREQAESDYGIDAHIELIQDERPTGQLLALQIKSGSSYLLDKDEQGFVFRTDEKHTNYWLNHSLPVLICLCDIDAKNIYWQIVNHETAVSTGKGYKFIIPSSQRVDSLSVESLRKLLTPVVPASRYTIFEFDDTSNTFIKCFYIKVVINGSATRAEIAAIVRQVTLKGIKSRYSGSHLLQERWGDSDAHVVRIFVYPTAEDYSRNLWICRSIWIDDELDEQWRPAGFTGENVGDGITVDWNANYHEWSHLLSGRTGSKEEYLSEILPKAKEPKVLFDKIEKMLRKYKETCISEEEFIVLSKECLTRVSHLYRESTNLPFSAPFECRDVNQKFHSFISSLDNIWIHYAEESRNTWSKENRLYLSLQHSSEAKRKLQEFEYELSKIKAGVQLV
ncbi:DUF4365 domain-containing protein [Candidatus Electronema sp. PJ]|uniref:DUF4365 domain-containing protein n=1 Tax=Candidatus Electronema sp. PJ TaxID=3401572 RepID=UPI003AA932BF